MDFQEDIRKQQLLDKINVIRTITTETKESAVEPISKSLFDEFEVADVDSVEKSLNTVGSLLGDEEVDAVEKAIGHKYFKREGTKGGYKYYYTEAEYKASKGGGGNTYPQASMQDEGTDIQEKVKERLAAKKQSEEDKAYDEEGKKDEVSSILSDRSNVLSSTKGLSESDVNEIIHNEKYFKGANASRAKLVLMEMINHTDFDKFEDTSAGELYLNMEKDEKTKNKNCSSTIQEG